MYIVVDRGIKCGHIQLPLHVKNKCLLKAHRVAVLLCHFSNKCLVREYAKKAKKAVKQQGELQRELDSVSRLMVRCKAGMLHICQKLKDVHVDSVSGGSGSPANSPTPKTESKSAESAKPEAKEGAEGAEKSSSEKPDPTFGLIKTTSAKVTGLLDSLSAYDAPEQVDKITAADVSFLYAKGIR